MEEKNRDPKEGEEGDLGASERERHGGGEREEIWREGDRLSLSSSQEELGIRGRVVHPEQLLIHGQKVKMTSVMYVSVPE